MLVWGCSSEKVIKGVFYKSRWCRVRVISSANLEKKLFPK